MIGTWERRTGGDEGALPLLSWDLRCYQHGDSVVVDPTSRDFELRLEGLPPARVLRFLARLDGSRPATRAADEAEVPRAAALALLETLFQHGVALDVRDVAAEEVEPDRFVAACRRMYGPLKERLFSGRLWSSLAAGTARRGLFLGWLIENYHFIDGVNDRLALAAAACPDARIRPFFVKHYTEEWDHSAFFLKSLAAFGIPREVATATRPLRGTVAALDHMRRCARRDPLQYAACSGFLESTGEDRQNAHAFLDAVAAHYEGDRPGAVKPIADHVRLDEAYQHNTVVEDICSRTGSIPFHRATAALSAASLLVETLELWSEEILRAYDRDPFVPRLALQDRRPPTIPTA